MREAFREFAKSHFYREGTADEERETAIAHSGNEDIHFSTIANWAGFNGTASDEFALPQDKLAQHGDLVAILEPITQTLDKTYRRILDAEPAVWAANPQDGLFIAAPNFLGIRRFCQLASTDAMRRFATGDYEGAARAIAAAKRITEKLTEHPALVSLMIRVATDALLAGVSARLPESEGWAVIAEDVSLKRKQFLNCIQIESWLGLRKPEQFFEPDNLILPDFDTPPTWVRRIANRFSGQRDAATRALNLAEHAAICSSEATLQLPDLGSSSHEAISKSRPTAYEIEVPRAMMRIHATLLLREQTEIIRHARARLAAGLSVESRNSVVLPATRWEVTADAQKNSVTTRLINAPKWITENRVTGDSADFWHIPIDGSAAWQFGTRPEKPKLQ